MQHTHSSTVSSTFCIQTHSTSSHLKVKEGNKENSVFLIYTGFFFFAEEAKGEKGTLGFLVPSLEDDEICCSVVPGDH